MPEKIVHTDYFCDAEDNTAEDMPATLITLTFTETDYGTKVICRSDYKSPEDLQKVLAMGMLQGITATWDKLAEYLETIG